MLMEATKPSSTEDRLAAALPKFKDIQRDTGIRRINIYIVRDHCYMRPVFKLKSEQIRVYLKAPLAMKSALKKAEGQVTALLDSLGFFNSNVRIKNCAPGYPLSWPAPLVNIKTGESVTLNHVGDKCMLVILIRSNQMHLHNEAIESTISLLTRRLDLWKAFRVVMCVLGPVDNSSFMPTLPPEAVGLMEYYKNTDSDNLAFSRIIKSEPEFMLVDKAGVTETVKKLCDPSLESLMDRMLKGELLWDRVDAKLLKTTGDKLLGEIEDFIQSRADAIYYAKGVFKCVVTTKRRFDLFSDLRTDRLPNVAINIEAIGRFRAIIDSVFSEFKLLFNEKKCTLQLAKRALKGSTAKLGTKCNKCSKSISGLDQYCCTQCDPPFYLCETCGRTDLDTIRLSDLPHNHLMFYIRTAAAENAEKIVYKKVRTNGMEPKHAADECAGCRAKIHSLVWACLNCDVTLCNHCFMTGRRPEAPEYGELASGLKTKGHDMEKHAFQRIIIN